MRFSVSGGGAFPFSFSYTPQEPKVLVSDGGFAFSPLFKDIPSSRKVKPFSKEGVSKGGGIEKNKTGVKSVMFAMDLIPVLFFDCHPLGGFFAQLSFRKES